MNLSDGERVRTILDEAGYIWTDDENQATVLGVIACSVRQKAIDKVYSRISKWNKRKNKENLITFISGCILPADKVKFLDLFDIIFQMSEIGSVPEMIRTYGVNSAVAHNPSASHKDDPEYMDKFWNIAPTYASDFEAFIPIQNGCNKFCTYCAVPYTRGREVSRPSGEILDELISLVDRGYKSITLLGQNVNSYGLDKKGEEISFSALLEKIGEYGDSTNHDFWLYFTSPHPRDMGDDVIEVLSRYKCLAKQIHIPLQSGDDEVLVNMNRKHDLERYRQIINSIRRIIPQATIFTDIIVGFTGETDQQFENTRKAMEEFKYNMAYVARYSPRPGAKSSEWKDDISHPVKSDRLRILSDELIRHSSEYNAKLVGQTFPVLITGTDRKGRHLSGYNEGRIVTRVLSDDRSMIGKFVDVKITGASELSIEGKPEGIPA
jgi:tRNA-2-methylthio-N6-dimethylallyladenosine synthase